MTAGGRDRRSQERWDGARYDDVAHPQSRWGDTVIERFDPNGLELVLDAGCGSGRVTETLLEAFPDVRVVALDASASMLDTARQRLARFGDRVGFVQASLADDFGPRCLAWGTFDGALSTGTFHWVIDHQLLFQRIHGVLAPGGQFVAQFGGEGSVLAVRRVLDELDIPWQHLNNYASAQDTGACLRKAGFDPVTAWPHDEVATFASAEEHVAYLHDGVLRPYLGHLADAEQREVAERVARRLDGFAVRFVRMNLVARRPR